MPVTAWRKEHDRLEQEYKTGQAELSPIHFIRGVVLEEQVWMHMKTVISYATRYEAHFVEMEQKLRLQSEGTIRGHRKRPA